MLATCEPATVLGVSVDSAAAQRGHMYLDTIIVTSEFQKIHEPLIRSCVVTVMRFTFEPGSRSLSRSCHVACSRQSRDDHEVSPLDDVSRTSEATQVLYQW